MIGAAAGWSARGFLGQDASLEEALALRASLAYAVFAADTTVALDVRDTGAGEVADWLGRRFELSAPPPLLTDLGFRLAGARLMMGETAPAALLVYDDGRDRRLVVFLRTDVAPSRPRPPRLSRAVDAATVSWTDGTLGVAVAGRLADADLMRSARLIGAGLGG
jgi:anti-sigma factor RsiW